jgi:transcriptional regulator with XRE-family HTH domain
MLPEVETLKHIRLVEDQTYLAMARELGIRNGTLHKLIAGKTHPNDRTLYKIRRFLDARKTRRRKAR